MRVLVLGGGSDQIDLIRNLRSYADEIVLLDYYDNPVARPFADRHYQESTLDLDAVEKVARAESVDLVLTACIDQALHSAAVVNERIGLPFYISPQVAEIATNKTRMKKRFQQIGVPTARYLKATEPKEVLQLGWGFPLVVKPVDSNGSNGVRRVDSEKELREALEAARQISRTNGVIIEEFVDGNELSVDVFVDSGRASVLLISCSEKRPVAEGFPIWRSHYPAALSESEQKEIQKWVQVIADGFEISKGPMIVQLIRGHSGIKVIEFGARIGGGSKHQFIRHLSGFDVMEAFVEMMFEQHYEVVTTERFAHAANVYSYCDPGVLSKIVGIEDLYACGTVDQYSIYKSIGMEIGGCMTSRDRPLSYICTANSEQELASKMIEAEKKLKVLDQDGRDILIRHL